MTDEQTKDDALTPSQPQSLTRRSAALVRRGLAEALTLQSGEAYYYRGREKDENGDYDGAIADFTRAIEINPRYAEAHNSRGIAKSHRADHDGAMADYTKAIEIDPRYANAYYNRGLKKRYKGDLDGAIADFTTAIEINLRLAEAYNYRGLSKRDKGDIDGAIDDYTIAIEINPRPAEAYNYRSLAKASIGDDDGAVADRAKAIEIDPQILQEQMLNILDLSIIGGFRYGKIFTQNGTSDFLAWKTLMLSDSDSVRRDVEEMTADESRHLYSRSKAMYVGYQNIFENGAQNFEIWSSHVLSNMDEDERNDVKPQLHNVYKSIVDELEEKGELEDLSKYYTRTV